MATLPVYDRTGREVGSYELEPTEIAPRISRQLMHDAVVMYQANRRQGSAKTKSRGEVAGASQKMYRQKGTGNARAGSRRSNIRRGGGMAFARRPRDYSYRMPRKAVQAATRMAIASKIADEELVIIDELNFEQPKTRDLAAILKALGLGNSTTLIATEEYAPDVYKSARNLAKVAVSPVSDLNTLSVLTPRKMLVTKAALDAIRSRYAAADNGAVGSPSATESSEGDPSSEAAGESGEREA